MVDVRVKRWGQGCTISHDTNACVALTVNAPLMGLRETEPTLQVQVVARMLGHVGAGEQAPAETMS